ncbi:SCO family protein [Muriicola soli]|uniref:SCO family protein n=1 Tax=Muriicola soli TaxID=2507538 RepID=A0A411E7Q0_9FLAO|nr:SCO family protein [Muriicola soli]QBA63741.1 SCO family protein [Muriicola soli]
MKLNKILLPTVICIAGLAIYLLYFRGSNTANEPKIYNPADLNPMLVDLDYQDVNKGYYVKDFRLINQNADTITHADYDGKIYVVDFFFTRCPSICPLMTKNMEALQTIFYDNDMVQLLSISVTPTLDSVEVLKRYAKMHNASSSKWNITTGDKRHIYDLARKSYFAVLDEGDGGLQDFIHTPNFILVDTQRQIRGIYNGTRSDEILRLKDDIELLLN